MTATGWELIEDVYGNGRWYTVVRSFEPDALMKLSAWIRANPHRRTRTRSVTYADATLSNALWSDVEEGYPPMADRNTTARDDGRNLAAALSALFTPRTPADNAAVFAVGRRFAVFAGYTDVDSAFAYIEGFVSGFGDTVARFTALTAQQESTDHGN